MTTAVGSNPDLETYRRELTGYCYRMLGSGFEAEDAVQETMVRAWRSIDRFEGRSALRSWLYRIATNVCLDMLQGPQRRARPMDLGPSSTADTAARPARRRARVGPADRRRAGGARRRRSGRDRRRRASRSASPSSPPCSTSRRKQRAVLILREVLRWQADEVAELLDTTVASVNSALQRARATLADADIERAGRRPTSPTSSSELLARYVDAFERYDIATLVVAAPRGRDVLDAAVRALARATRSRSASGTSGKAQRCEGSKLVADRVNGSPAFCGYKPDPTTGGWSPFSLQIIEVADGRIVGLHHFLYPELFAARRLPDHLEPQGVGQAGEADQPL